jgi:uracil-DNA glycosylase family 4
MADRAELSRLLARQLDGLRRAGIEWLPTTAPVALPATPLPPPELQPEVNMSEEPSADSAEDRRVELEVLAGRVAECTRCAALASTRTQTVFGDGPLDVDICFVGEAPGANEDATGHPFVGNAGQLLTRIINACGLKREEVYICNALKCRPPGNRTPTVEEMRNCSEYLQRQLELVRPHFLVCLGGSATKALLSTSLSLARLRGKFHDYHGIPVVCTYHPSYLLKLDEPAKTEHKRLVWEDMKMLLARMGRAIPGQQARRSDGEPESEA